MVVLLDIVEVLVITFVLVDSMEFERRIEGGPLKLTYKRKKKILELAVHSSKCLDRISILISTMYV